MADRNTFTRTLHDAGLAAWFGGSLMGAVGLNGASQEVREPDQRARVANAGWNRWTPVNAAAIGAHLIGGAGITLGNKGRLAGQKGVATASVAKALVTAAALAATAYSRTLGQKVIDAGDVPVEGGASPGSQTPPDVADAQRQLATLQWVIPALTGTVLVMNAYMGEQQRATEVGSGFLARLLPGS